MIVLKKSHVLLIVVVSCLLLVYFGIECYSILKISNVDNDFAVKYQAENFIYFSVLATLILIVLWSTITVKSTNILKEMDKIIELSAYGNYDLGEHLRKLGAFGIKVDYLMSQLDKLNRMKSLKISSLSAISSFFIENTDALLFLLDGVGTIINCSQQIGERFDADKSDVVNKKLTEFIDGLNFEEVLFDLNKTHSAVLKKEVTIQIKDTKEKVPVVFYPITNVENQVSHVIGIMGDEKLILKLSERGLQPPPHEQQIRKKSTRTVRDYFRGA